MPNAATAICTVELPAHASDLTGTKCLPRRVVMVRPDRNRRVDFQFSLGADLFIALADERDG
jgi:hypothetical protein